MIDPVHGTGRFIGVAEREREKMVDDVKVKNEALQIIGQYQNLPRLVVFDLDYTLWPFFWYSSSSK